MTSLDSDQRLESSLWRWLLGSASAITVLALFFPIAYGANDDAVIPMSLARILDSRIDPLVTPLAPLFALALGWLYELAPQVPWYGISLGFATATGLGLIGHGVCWRRLPPGLRIPLAIGIGLLAFDAAWFWTFTKAMLLLQFGAFLQVFRWQVERDRETFPYASVILSLIAGYCFRWHFFHYSLAFAFPIALAFRRRHAVPLLIVAACFGAFRGGDAIVRERLHAGDETYRALDAFNWERHRLNGMPEGYESTNTPAALKRVGWELDDLRFFRDLWGIYDERIVTTESLRKFLDANGKAPASAKSRVESLTSTRPRVALVFLGVNLGVITAMALPLLLLVFPALRRGSLGEARNALVVAGLFALFFYLLMTRLPVRVAEPVLLYAGATLALLAGNGNAPSWRRSAIVAVIAIQCMALLPWGLAFARDVGEYAETNAGLRELVGRLDPAIAERIVIAIDPRKGLSAETNHPIRDEARFDRGFNAVPCGTNVNSPAYRRFLARHGYSGGHALLLGAMTNEKVAFFWYGDQPEAMRLWLSYVNRRLASEAGRTVEFRTLAATSDGRMALLELVEAK